MNYVKLESVAEIIMGQSPNGTTYNNDGIGLPLLNGPTEFGQTYPNCTIYTTDSKRECKKNSLIFCVRGSTTGRMNWADKVYSLGRGVCSITGKTILETKFVKYCLDARLESLLILSGGGTFPNLTKDTIFQFEIPYPKSRQKIASILSAYDDLIENNTRRIQILEEMARRIYEEWFVHFRFPNHENIKLVESELGLIPEGWEVKKLGELCEVGRGSSPRPITDSRYFENGTIPWIKIADATKSGKFLYETKEKVNSYGASFSRLLPKGSIIVAASGTLGFTQILGIDGCIHDGWLYLSKYKSIEIEYLYFYLETQRRFFQNSAYGAAIQNINTMILRDTNIVLPPMGYQKKFSKIISSIDSLLDNLGRKNMNLRKTRDLLLPKLISGEIDVSEFPDT